MKSQSLRRVSFLGGLALLLAAGCAPSGQGPVPQGTNGALSPLKTLTLGINATEEPGAGGFAYGASGTGGQEPAYILHAGLTVYDEQRTLQPRLAQRVPTIENGDWTVFSDGRMELTWKLRSDVVWHDGTPLVADDLVVGFRAALDPELFLRGTRVLSQIAEVTAPDSQTLIVRWKNIYILASDMKLVDTIVPLNRHLAALYDTGDKQAFAASPLLSDEWVGLGPYRLRQWLRGSFIEADAFDQYFLGKPRIDRIAIRYIGDTNTLVVNTIAGQITVVPVGSLQEGEAHVLKTQWEATGAGTVILDPIALVIGGFQFRDPNGPWVRDARARMALVKLLDRQSMVDTILNGLSGVDDIIVPREALAYRVAQQRGLPNLSYDVPEAHRLLAAAGLARGPDGSYRSQSGEPFHFELVAQGDSGTRSQLVLAIANQWKTAGLEATNTFISSRDADWQRSATLAQGAYFSRKTFTFGFLDSFTTSELSSEANRFRASNRGGYSNPDFDQLQSRFWSTLGSSDRDQIAADGIKMLLDQVVYLPTIYNSEVSAVGKAVRGVTNVTAGQLVTAWNIHQWDMA